ncbi:hypothetical protein C8R45DRAFT_1103897 [Mycena sanguinolenta]|nr:hypothetical protein C8R45DRAFT_1103897 [Mycena sanguinolenta]
MALLLPNLPLDVIFSIFARCDICSVVSASQTCRYLHNLAFDKSIWIGLLDNLRRKSILDRTDDLETLSVAEMIGIVRRLITGPLTWTPGELDHDPVAEISKTITLHPRTYPGNPGSASVELLPSGCYVLFRNQHTLECWNVAHDRLVWRHTPAVEHTMLIDFGAEETDTDLAIIMIYGPMLFIEIVNVDLGTGTHNCLLAARTPHFELVDKPVICETLAAVRFESGYMIINWREKSYFIIRGHDSHYRFALIPRHIVVLKSSVDGEPQLHLIPNDTIGTFFSPTISLDDAAELAAVSVEEMPKVHTLPLRTQSFAVTGVRIHTSPICDADYRVWIWGTNDTLLSYQLSIPVDGEPKWRLQKAVLHGIQLMSYSHHVVYYEPLRGGWTINPRPSAANPRLQLLRDARSIDLAPYSGALTCLGGDSTIVIQYYK